MMNYYVFLAPAAGEPYRFVTGMRRRWLFWRRVEYSYLPATVSVEDYAQLDGLVKTAERETGRGVKVCLADKMEECCGDNLYWAVMDKDGMWFTGKWYADARRKSDGNGGKQAEVTQDIREAQLFVREAFAIDQRLDLQRNGHEAAVVPVYVNTRNVFSEPCIVIVCVNKLTKEVRYLKSYKVGDHRLRYTDRLSEALLINVEDVWKTDERLTPAHKNISFTFIVRPEFDIAGNKLREHEKELVQRIACDYYIGHHGKKERTKG